MAHLVMLGATIEPFEFRRLVEGRFDRRGFATGLLLRSQSRAAVATSGDTQNRPCVDT